MYAIKYNKEANSDEKLSELYLIKIIKEINWHNTHVYVYWQRGQKSVLNKYNLHFIISLQTSERCAEIF